MNDDLKRNGLIIKNGRIYGDKRNADKARQFVARLRQAADEAERQAAATTPYQARLLGQNARAARRDADRIEASLL